MEIMLHVGDGMRKKKRRGEYEHAHKADALGQDSKSTWGTARNTLICIPLDLTAECKIQHDFLGASHSSIKKTSDIQIEGPVRQNDSPQVCWGVSQKYNLRKNSSYYGQWNCFYVIEYYSISIAFSLYLPAS